MAEKCGCSLNFSLGPDEIPYDLTRAYCPMHKAAPEMLAALERIAKTATQDMNISRPTAGSIFAIIEFSARKVVALAQGKAEEYQHQMEERAIALGMKPEEAPEAGS